MTPVRIPRAIPRELCPSHPEQKGTTVKPTEQRRTWMFVLTAKRLRGSVDRKSRARAADSLCARGTRAPSRNLIATPLILLCALIGLLGLSTGVAQAEAPGLVSFGSFGSEQLNVENSETHQSESTSPIGVAVDQSSGDVYVSSFLSAHVEKFGASGKLISPPSPFGEGSGHESGVAVNPTDGNVYVVDGVNQAVDTYDPSTGGLLSSFSVPGCASGFTLVQIAADSAGNVYLPCAPENEVREYSPSGTLLQTITGTGTNVLSGPTGVAVDSSGNVWVADTANGRVEEFSSTGVFVREIKSEGVQSLAVDAAGDVFALVYNSADFCGSFSPPCYHLVEYSSAGVQLADVGAGQFGESLYRGFFGVSDMVAVDDSTGRVYVTDGGNGVVWVFGAPSAPVVGRELAVEVGTSEVKLGALITPGGLDTTYHFEYGTNTSYGQTAPVPDGDVGTGIQPRTVWAAASELQPGATYHYRVIATNALGTIFGVDQTFTTEAAGEGRCPNEQFRTDFSGSLPDCRAYELVTPPQTDAGEPDVKEKGRGQTFSENNASSDGDRMSYFSLSSFPGSQAEGKSYLATRGSNGWSSESEIPPQSGYYQLGCPVFGTAMPSYSTDLSMGVLVDGMDQTAGKEEGGIRDNGGCGADSPELVSGEPRGVANLFLRDNDNDSYQLINVTPPGATPARQHASMVARPISAMSSSMSTRS